MFNGKTILITGGTGSWGNELTRQLLRDHKPKEIRIFSRGEMKQVQMRIRFDKFKDKIRFIIGDVRDANRMDLAMKGVDYVFHLAALKHVPVCEDHPWETVQTNIVGTQNVVEAALKNKILAMIHISTDKAVDPCNIYGVTKACGEKLVIAANLLSEGTRFVCIRGGNVLGSNGSVVPLFRQQLLSNNIITLTDKRMSRYMFTLHDAIQLIFKATEKAIGGEIFVMKMPALKVVDLIEVMKRRLGNADTQVREIGMRPGEKLHELLVSRYDVENTVEDNEYFIILPNVVYDKLKGKYASYKKIPLAEYNSENTQRMDQKQIEALLESHGFFDLGTMPSEEQYFGQNDKEILDIFKKQGWQK